MRYILISTSVMNFFLPVAMTALSVALLIIAKKSASRFRDSLKWEGVATIDVTVVAYVFTNMPYNLESFHFSLKSLSLYQSPQMFRFAVHLLTLNIMSNFFIYCLTIRSFREFLKLKISKILSLGERSVHPVRRPAPTSQIIELQQRNVDTRLDKATRHDEATRRDETEIIGGAEVRYEVMRQNNMMQLREVMKL